MSVDADAVPRVPRHGTAGGRRHQAADRARARRRNTAAPAVEWATRRGGGRERSGGPATTPTAPPPSPCAPAARAVTDRRLRPDHRALAEMRRGPPATRPRRATTYSRHDPRPRRRRQLPCRSSSLRPRRPEELERPMAYQRPRWCAGPSTPGRHLHGRARRRLRQGGLLPSPPSTARAAIAPHARRSSTPSTPRACSTPGKVADAARPSWPARCSG